MYGHPLYVRHWAKVMKPKAAPRLIEQARLMRLAKVQKRDYLTRQKDLFGVVA
ncbi:hypothetical protein [Thiobacillus sp.]|jgi:hypothetical protein|uniref:hypothetical protein n=1 Tax=Thiobacillus sp. TaxID=924 RepID=UPI0025E81AD4|nr:hypothetical protein [Thiobacillus sp.]